MAKWTLKWKIKKTGTGIGRIKRKPLRIKKIKVLTKVDRKKKKV